MSTASTSLTLPQTAFRLSPAEEAWGRSPLRKLGFYSALGLVFLQYSRIHETLAFLSGGNTFLLYVFAVPALAILAGSGGLQRVLRERSALLWMGCTLWMVIDIPFSSWPGGSASDVLVFIRVVLPVMFVIAGLPMTWKEVRTLLYVIALGGLAIIGTSRAFIDTTGGRFGLEYGIISNPNDYAAHLILVLPIILFMVICRPRVPILGDLARIAGAMAIGYGLYLILRTASRGALVAILVSCCYILIRSSARTRIAMMVLLPLTALVMSVTIPKETLTRLMSFSTADSAGEVEEAVESAASRQHLFEESVKLSFTHPLFGVGPGQFTTYEGFAVKARGGHGGWLNTHNSFTQISSECGLPAFLLYISAVFTTFGIFLKVGKSVQGRPELKQVQLASWCLTLSFLGFIAAIFFVNFGYFFYLPAFTGIAISLKRVVNGELAAGTVARPAAAAVPVAITPAVPVQAGPVRNRYRFGRMR